MLYRKNLPGPERALRLLAGAAMVAAGLWMLGSWPMGLALGLAASGVVALGTALFGFCPACAMVGRRPLE